MNASALLETLTARGVALQAHGEKLRWSPRDAVTPIEVEALRQHKADLLNLLARRDACPDGLPAFHRDLFTTVRETMGADAALDLLPSLVLGARLATGQIEALWCGIKECRCMTCRGIPCRGSTPWEAAPGEKNVRDN